MTALKNYISKADIFFSCSEKGYRVREHFVEHHALSYILSGSMKIIEGDKEWFFEEGQTGIVQRNQLAKFIKYPSETKPFQSISILFRPEFLQQYYAGITNRHPVQKKAKVSTILKSPLLDSLFASILPYYEMNTELPLQLVELKLTEALTALRTIDPSLDNVFSDFAVPGKIDLASFMEHNYNYNLPIKRFAYLSGRSLATFKRDFQKTFNTSPEKWLKQKRLEQAHYLIAEQRFKPVDAFYEVGFETLSHFSSAFKQLFGYNPSSLAMSRSGN